MNPFGLVSITMCGPATSRRGRSSRKLARMTWTSLGLRNLMAISMASWMLLRSKASSG